MTKDIEAFGSDGMHEIRFGRHSGQDEPISVKRDLWFDHDDQTHWVVWAQERRESTDGSPDGSPSQQSAKPDTIGSIIVTNPDVIAFLEELGRLLHNPAAFGDEPEFGRAKSESRQGDV